MSATTTPGVMTVQAFFAAHRHWFETVEAAAVAFDEAGEAERLRAAVLAGERRFPAAAPAVPEIVEPRPREGYLGVVTRADLPPELAEPLFGDAPGPLLGPVRYDGRHWLLHRLLPRRPEMNAAVYDLCVEAILRERDAQPGSGGR